MRDRAHREIRKALLVAVTVAVIGCSGAPAPLPKPAYAPPPPRPAPTVVKPAAKKAEPSPAPAPPPAAPATAPEKEFVPSPLLLPIPKDRTDEKTGLHWLFNSDLQIWFSDSEITVAQFRKCIDSGRCGKPYLDSSVNYLDRTQSTKNCNFAFDGRDDYPMNCVDWAMADWYCRWAGGRLPTALEWFTEASNSGTRYFPWGNDKATCVRATMGPMGCETDSTGPVCSKLAGRSVSGLCDMAGSVAEWTSSHAYGSDKRISAGGSWLHNDYRQLRASSQVNLPEGVYGAGLGFRCVSDPGCGRLDDEVQLAPDEVRQPDTCLIWKRCPRGKSWDGIECTGSKDAVMWQQAVRACPEGFRLPTRQEFISLLGDCRQTTEFLFAGGNCSACGSSPTCASMFGEDEGDYWTGTSEAEGLPLEDNADPDDPPVSHLTAAWAVGFDDGAFDSVSKDVPGSWVRCVRTAMTELPPSAEEKETAVVVTGNLTAAAIRRVARQHGGDLERCVPSLSPGAEERRRVAIKFIVTSEGGVQMAAVEESNIGDPAIEKCLVDEVKSWQFPKPKYGGIVVVRYPFLVDALEKSAAQPTALAAPSGPGTIKLTSDRSCWALLVTEAEAKKSEHGWWSVWQEKKERRAYFPTPHVFEKLRPGKYTLVVFDPASENYDPNNGRVEEQSDGVVLQSVVVSPGAELDLHVKNDDFIEWNCLSCPWLYIFDGQRYVRTVEVLEDVVGRERQARVAVAIPRSSVIDSRLRLRISEEKEEITFLDSAVLRVGATEIAPSVDGDAAGSLSRTDGEFRQLAKGAQVDLVFVLPAGVSGDAPIELVVSGYYEPDDAMLETALTGHSRR